MDFSSSSFEISSETIEKSFSEYETITEGDSSEPIFFSEEIKNPVKDVINKLSKLQVNKKLTLGTLDSIIPIINDSTSASIELPKIGKLFKSNVQKSFKSEFYVKCKKCCAYNIRDVPCSKCDTITEKKRNNFFIYIPIEPQIKKTLIEHFDSIRKHLNRELGSSYTDTDQGNVQSAIIKKYTPQNILSLTLNIDGGNVASNSTHSLWPVQLYQNFLPPSKRFLPENILVVALHYGEKKPNPYELLFPLLRDLRHLSNVGIQLMYNGIQYDFLPLLLFSCCDLPARALLQSFKHPTGSEACPVCVYAGVSNKEGKTRRIRYIKENLPSKIRTHDETVADAHISNSKGRDAFHRGVKGLSCLMALPDFDIINGFSTDYMHGVFLGTVKRLISIWLGGLKLTSPNMSNFKTISKQNQVELNRRICALKPYSRISYKPRSLEFQALFRAIEYKYLCLYYLTYSLRGLLEKRYIEHFTLLSAGIYILSKHELDENDICKAEKMLDEFCNQFEKLYGVNAVTLNLHLLRHYGLIVRNTGPLWCHSLFGFETNMGVLAKYSSGGLNVLEQISEKYIIAKSQNVNTPMDQTPSFTVNLKCSSEHDNMLHQCGLSEDGIIKKTTHVTVGRNIYKSLYSKPTQSVDYFLEMKDGSMGISVFYIVKDNNLFVLLNDFTVIKDNYHLKEVKKTDHYKVYPFDCIKQKHIYLTFASTVVVTTEPNTYEKS